MANNIFDDYEPPTKKPGLPPPEGGIQYGPRRATWTFGKNGAPDTCDWYRWDDALGWVKEPIVDAEPIPDDRRAP